MFYLAKFCRICINTNEKLLDIYSKDYDSVEFSKKLEVCAKKVINKEDLSTQICMSCVEKLRISYVFTEMCTQSDDILQRYLNELLTASENDDETFINSDFRVTITPLPRIKVEKFDQDEESYISNVKSDKVPLSRIRVTQKYKQKSTNKGKRKRVSKGQRCSLLKKLLLSINNNTVEPTTPTKKPASKKRRGGLKDLLVFIKGYDFGYKINEPVPEANDITALDQLERFSETFFYSDFADYRNTILSVIESNLESSDEDDMFDSYDEDEDRQLWRENIRNIKQEKIDEEYEDEEQSTNELQSIEEVMVAPDIKIKSELISENEYDSGLLASELVQTCYDENITKNDYINYYHHNNNGNLRHKYHTNHSSSSVNNSSVIGGHSSFSVVPSSLELLQQFTNRTKGSNNKRTISPNSLKCRTRGQPFINPQLMEQFQKRSFKCDTCNRCFKSPGYLHSHCTKMGH